MMNNSPQPILITSTGKRLYKKEAMEKLCEYVDAEEAGILVRLPCALGTECYYANPALHEVCPSEIIGFEFNKYTNPSLWIEFSYISRWVGRHCCDII